MEDFWRPVIQDEYFVVRQPAIEANNFELKPTLITMVQQHQFNRHPSEDPNDHMGRFMRMASTVKLNGVGPKVIKMQLFPFSLKDVAATWFESLPVGSVNNWEELVEAYMSRFFPPTLTFERRGEIIVFKQGEDESLYNAWERYKKLLKICPMHGIDLTTQMDIFYHAMNYTSKCTIDAACCKAFKRKRAEKAKQLIEDLAKCNYKASSETSWSSSRLKGIGMLELNRMTAIEAKLDALMSKMANQERRMHSTNEVGTIDENEKRNSAEEGLAHGVPIKFRRHNILMLLEVTILSPTSTCQLITYQHLGTMRISHVGEEHNKVTNMGRIFNNTMLHLGFNNNNNSDSMSEGRKQGIKEIYFL